MSILLKISLIVFIILIAIIVLLSIKNGKLTVKYSLIWLTSSIFLIITLIIPNFLEQLTRFFGFQVASNMIFLFSILILLGMVFSLTIIITGQSKKIQVLIQELAILKNKLNNKEDKKK